MDWFGFTANAASLLCLPATIASIPGIAVMFSPTARSWLERFPWLRWIPVIILTFLIAIDVAARSGWIGSEAALQEIVDRSFQDEKIILDGKQFYNCTFTNVTFIYNGGSVIVSNSKIINLKGIETTNKDVSGTFAMLKALNIISPSVQGVLIPNSMVLDRAK